MDTKLARPQICITGCGCSGTRYIAKVLKRADVHVGHEVMAADGMSSWYVAVGETELLPPFGRKNQPRRLIDFPSKPIILHQVRNPLDVITSFQRVREKSWEYIFNWVPGISHETPIVFNCMVYWYIWNQIAEKVASWRYRVEDLKNMIEEFCDRIERPYIIRSKKTMLENSKKENSRAHIRRARGIKDLTWKDLYNMDAPLTDKIKELGTKYGYDL